MTMGDGGIVANPQFRGVFYSSSRSGLSPEAVEELRALPYACRLENPRFADPNDPIRYAKFGADKAEDVPVHIMYGDPLKKKVCSMVSWVTVHGAPEPEQEAMPEPVKKRGPGRPRKTKPPVKTVETEPA